MSNVVGIVAFLCTASAIADQQIEDALKHSYPKKVPESINGDFVFFSETTKHLRDGSDDFHIKVVPQGTFKIDGRKVSSIVAKVNILCGGHGDSGFNQWTFHYLRGVSAQGSRIGLSESDRRLLARRFNKALASPWLVDAQCVLKDRLLSLPR